MANKRIIRKVWKHNYNGQKFITIPKFSDIESGDYVEVKKIKEGQNDE